MLHPASSLASKCRQQFPALARPIGGREVIYFDGPAGSQVPQRVIDAMTAYLQNKNANHGGHFATSQESDALLEQAHAAFADFLNVSSPEAVVFGANMTTLTFALSRALAQTWRAGDEIVVTRLDHDANTTPWVMAARDVGAKVRWVEIKQSDCTLDLDSLERQINPRTRLVAVGCASNAVGTVNPVEDICRLAHSAGAHVFLDAVHFAPHAMIRAADWHCDFIVCSAYKFFGPHVGILWGRPELLGELPAYKVQPAPNSLPGKWMTGTQNHEGIAGAFAAIGYLESLGQAASPSVSTRRARLVAAYQQIAEHESELVAQLLEGLNELRKVRIWGITAPDRLRERLPTVAITHRDLTPAEMARRLGAEGIFVWHGNFYALELSRALGLEPAGMLRIGLLHYNTVEEVQRLLDCLGRWE